MLGLLLACVDSVLNVLTDVARKKVLDRDFDVGLVTVWCKGISCVFFAVVLATLRLGWGSRPELPDIGHGLNLAPAPAFLLYVSLNAVVEGGAILLYLRALQVSPFSYCVPFLAFTPLFLLPTGIVFLHETISGGMVIGVSLVVIGALVMNRQMFARGPFEPVWAIVRERGSRYMLIVAFLLTFTNALDKWFLISGVGTVTFDVKLARSVTLAMGKCGMLSLFFAGLTALRMRDRSSRAGASRGFWQLANTVSWTGVVRAAAIWLVLAGVLDGMVLVLQLTALQFIVAAVAICIKRAGLILAVILGWFVFKERGITDRVIASVVMTVGVLIFFLTNPDAAGRSILDTGGAMGVSGCALVAMSVALYFTRHRNVLPLERAN
jgi:uncharacterized membrane protein